MASNFFNLVAGLPETSQFRAELVRVTSRAQGGSLTRKEQQAFWSVSRQSLCAYDHKPTDLLNEIKKTPQAGAPRKALGFVWRAQQFWFDICSSSSATEVICREVPDEGLVILRPIYWLTVPLIEAYRAFKEFTSNLLGYHTFVACRPKQVKDAQVVTCLCVHSEDGKDAKAQLARLKLRQSTLKPGETLTAKQLLEVREHEQTISEYESHKKLSHPPRPTPTSAPLLGDPADNVNPANQLFTVSSMEGEVEGEAEGEHVEPPPGALGCEGPIEDADTCPSCHKEVTYECDALQCDRCDRWWHLGACCGRKRFPPGHIDWFCSGCLPKA